MLDPMMKNLLRFAPLLLLSLLTACADNSLQNPISQGIVSQIKAGDKIDLALLGPEDWQKVCIFGPYTSNDQLETVVGFPWDIEAKNATSMGDGTTLLLFIQDQTVLASVDHPRDKGDFDRLADQCFERSEAQFTYEVDADGWGWVKN
jgi:hypothetical protein